MPLVDVTVNGRSYKLACDEGQEDHLQSLARVFDKRVQGLLQSVGQAGDPRLLLMAGLVLADELTGTQVKLAERERELADLKEKLAGGGQSAEDRIAELLEQAAVRIEGIAARVARA